MEFPDTFAVSFEENNGFVFADAGTFSFTAPSSTLPSAATLTGADAQFFTVTFDISAPDGSGVRQVAASINTSTAFNFEAPLDEDGDNVYMFQISVVFEGETLTADVTVTILDVADEAETDGASLTGSVPGQGFGAVLTTVPDFDGDGVEDILVSIQTDIGDQDGFAMSTAFLEGLAAGTQSSVADFPISDFGAELAPVPFEDSSPFTLVTGGETSTGSQILIAQPQVSAMTQFFYEDAAGFDAFGDVLDASTMPPDAATSTLGVDGQQGQLIGDVNGDGIDDIFVRTTGDVQPFGIIFGDPASPGFTMQGLAFDMELQFDSFIVEDAVSLFHVGRFPDLDGDGIEEVFIIRNAFSDERFYVVTSTALNSGAAAIDLDDLSATEGFEILSEFADVTITDDFDGDGAPTVLLTNVTNDLFVVDADDFAAMLGTNDQIGFSSPASSLTRAGGQFVSQIRHAGDLDGDGLSEIIGSSPFRSSLMVIDGADIQAAAQTPGTQTVLPAEDVLEITVPLTLAQPIVSAPIIPEGGSSVLFGLFDEPQIVGALDTGRIVVIPRSVIETSFAADATEILVRFE